MKSPSVKEDAMTKYVQMQFYMLSWCENIWQKAFDEYMYLLLEYNDNYSNVDSEYNEFN